MILRKIYSIALLLCTYLTTIAQGPFASTDSKWNYWFASASYSGIKEFKVEKDTTITAPFYGETEKSTITCSKIGITNKVISTNDLQQYTLYLGYMIAFRDGDVAYIYDEYHDAYFKWIDMNAEPGDKWLFPEHNIAPTMHVIDYIEVQNKGLIEINGQEIPYVEMMPSCSSQFDAPNDYTSRIVMNGSMNIDIMSLYDLPYASPNGENYLDINEEMCFGLLCAENGNLQVDMPALEEYFEFNLTYLYEQGIVECDSLSNPIWDKKAPISTKHKTVNKEDFSVNPKSSALLDNEYMEMVKKSRNRNMSNENETILPVVVHIIHNPDTPEELITEMQINEMLTAINEAYSATNDQSWIRDEFINVVGNPNIRFCLATMDPEGNPTTGIIYQETDKEEFPMWYGTNQEKYGFKYDNEGNSNSWDNLKYVNIWVVDLAFETRHIGGFVTNPESSDPEVVEDWLANNSGSFWRNWILSDEGQELDGLTVDFWATFGGASGTNPDATFNTAIHELGHFCGLRHTFTNLWNSTLYGDGFDDTPYTHYAQYKKGSCNNEIRQCGNLVQVENFMDYAIECQCMFTHEQSAFLNTFLETNRMELLSGNYFNCPVLASSQAQITQFKLDEQIAPATINENTHSISILVKYGTDIRSLSPTVTISEGATCYPESGVTTDFTNPVTYTVTAEDGTTQQEWTVLVSIASGIELKRKGNYKVYPNPAEDVIYIEQDVEKASKIRILNLQGTTILKDFMNDNLKTIECNDLNPGMYVIEVRNNYQSEYFKVIVK